MIKASILIIGNEILSGRTLDKNSNFICNRCSDLGIVIDQIRVIPDNKNIIKKVVLELSKKYNYVFVTGGIGPTHDDITAISISEAFNRRLVLNKKAKNLLIKHYENSNVTLNESRLKMALIPEKANLILNPVSSAPGFKIKNVWVMAGVPKIMQAMFIDSIEPKLKKGKAMISKSVCVQKAEGDIAEILNDLDRTHKNLEIGSYPFYQPPKIGTNVIFRSQDEKVINKAIKILSKKLKNKNILFSV